MDALAANDELLELRKPLGRRCAQPSARRTHPCLAIHARSKGHQNMSYNNVLCGSSAQSTVGQLIYAYTLGPTVRTVVAECEDRDLSPLLKGADLSDRREVSDRVERCLLQQPARNRRIVVRHLRLHGSRLPLGRILRAVPTDVHFIYSGRWGVATNLGDGLAVVKVEERRETFKLILESRAACAGDGRTSRLRRPRHSEVDASVGRSQSRRPLQTDIRCRGPAPRMHSMHTREAESQPHSNVPALPPSWPREPAPARGADSNRTRARRNPREGAGAPSRHR